jgi:polysaccharide export outer membrane protein
MNAKRECAGRTIVNRRRARWAALVATAILTAGCATGPAYPPAPRDAASSDYDYKIGPMDVVNVIVWRNPELSLQVPVRPDGKITTPLIEDLPAHGKTPTVLARDIEKALGKYIRDPVVTVIVTTFVGPASEQIRVIGEAAKPQILAYRQNMTVLDVMIAVAASPISPTATPRASPACPRAASPMPSGSRISSSAATSRPTSTCGPATSSSFRKAGSDPRRNAPRVPTLPESLMDELIHQLTTYLRGMWQRRWIGLAAAWVAAIVGVAVVMRIPDRYEASSRVYVDTQSLLRPLMAGLSIQPNIEQQVGLLSRTLISRPNVEKLIRMTDLDLGITSASERDQLIESLTRGLRLSGNPSNNLYVITYRDSPPDRARRSSSRWSRSSSSRASGQAPGLPDGGQVRG